MFFSEYPHIILLVLFLLPEFCLENYLYLLVSLRAEIFWFSSLLCLPCLQQPWDFFFCFSCVVCGLYHGWIEENFLPSLYWSLKSVICQHLLKSINTSFIFIVVCNFLQDCCLVLSPGCQYLRCFCAQCFECVRCLSFCSQEIMSLANNLNWWVVFREWNGKGMGMRLPLPSKKIHLFMLFQICHSILICNQSLGCLHFFVSVLLNSNAIGRTFYLHHYC